MSQFKIAIFLTSIVIGTPVPILYQKAGVSDGYSVFTNAYNQVNGKLSSGLKNSFYIHKSNVQGTKNTPVLIDNVPSAQQAGTTPEPKADEVAISTNQSKGSENPAAISSSIEFSAGPGSTVSAGTSVFSSSSESGSGVVSNSGFIQSSDDNSGLTSFVAFGN